MTDEADPLEPLRRLRQPSRDLRPGDDPTADALLRNIHQRLDADEQADESPPRRRRAALLIGIAATVTVVGGTVAAVVLRRPADEPVPVSCWADTTPTAQWATERLGPDFDVDELCTLPWTDGTFGTNGPPDLTACVSREGITAIIPGDPSTCDSIGLDRFDPENISRDAQITWHLTSELVDALAAGCFDHDETVELVQAALDDANADHWTIEAAGAFDDAAPCGTVDIRMTETAVYITSYPG